jgi:hypothetical protein
MATPKRTIIQQFYDDMMPNIDNEDEENTSICGHGGDPDEEEEE